MKRISMIILMITLFTVTVFAGNDEPSSWAEEFVNNVKDQNVLEESFFTGYHNPITRGEFAYLGVKLYEEYTGLTAEVGVASFTDTSDEWALKAKNIGVVGGYPDGSFKLDNPIRRDELAVLFHNVFKAAHVEFVEYEGDLFADDAEIASWAKNSVYIAKANGIISGVGDNRFSATGSATKEESLIMLSKGQTSEFIVPQIKNEEVSQDIPVVEGNSSDSVIEESTPLEIGSTLLYKTKDEAYAFVEEHCGIFDYSEYAFDDNIIHSITGENMPLSVEVTNGIVSSISFGNQIKSNPDGSRYIVDWSNSNVTVYGYSLIDSYETNKLKMGSMGLEENLTFGDSYTGIIKTNRLIYWINESAHFAMTYSADDEIHIGISINN